MSLVLRDAVQQRDFPDVNPSITLREILSLVFRNRGKMLLAFLIPPLIAIGLYFVLTPVYRAESGILVKTGREYLAQGDEASSMSAPTSTKQEGINSEMALITSRAVIQATIDSIGLANLYPDLLESPPRSTTVQDAAIEAFTKDMGVDVVKLSNIFNVAFEAGSPAKAEMVLNRLIDVYIAKHIEVFAGDRTEGYQASINTILAEIERLERRRTQIKLDNRIYDMMAQRSALITQRVEVQSHLQDLIGNRTTLTDRLAYLTKARPSISSTMQTTNMDRADEATHAREALTDLRQTEASMAARYGDDNPDLRRVRGQIAAMQGTLSSTGTTRMATATAPSPLAQQIDQEIVMDNAELAPLPSEIARYQALLTSIGDELHRLEQADLDLRTVSTRIEALTDNLKVTQARYEAARTQEQTDLAKQVSVVQIAPAMSPDKQVKPKKLYLVAGGLVAGLFAAFAVAVFSVLTNRSVVNADSVERLVGLPVLVSLPLLGRRAGAVTLDVE